MIAIYDHYHYLEPAIELFISRMNEMRCRNYASELLKELIASGTFDMADSVKRTIAIFQLSGIPVHNHIAGVFRSDFNGTRRDWRLSELACSIIILTTDCSVAQVRDIQNDLIEYLKLLR